MTGKGGKRSRLGLWFTIGSAAFLMLAVGIPLGLVLRDVEVPIRTEFALGAVAMLTVVFTLMLSQTLSAAVEALYQRADLDLLFSSPIAPDRVMTVRFLGLAFSVTLIFLYFIAPPLIPIAILGHPEWLALLAVLCGLGLAASGAGLLLAMGLFRLIGPRRTRTVAQLLAAFIGAAFFLLTQLRNILGGERSESVFEQTVNLAKNPSFHPPPGLTWPLRALVGEPLPLAALLLICVAVFAGATRIVGRRFAADAAAAAGASRTARGRKPAAVHAFAAGPFQATLRKEMRLLLRDPALITQVLLRVLYMLPLGFLLLRQAARGEDLLLPGAAAGLSLMASQVAGSLAWITVSAEDAPDLIACSPAPVRMVWRAKLAAAVLPVAVLLALVLIPLTVLSPWIGLVAVVGCAANVIKAALLNLWWQRPGKRSEFQARRKGGFFVSLAEFLLSLLVAAGTGLLAAHFVWGLLPLGLAACALLLLRRSEAQIGAALRAAS
ncbi:hypothetical protein DJ018_14970 [Phenylobacterium deserti]|uniref:Permease n=2 Tax=Phenylobacterium deserti TaxID=1914756 RepID=A0A328AA77_9CAUL|nr:hypothetical protein DJ018_14970 [Phenylobacterium deserti]